MPVFVQLETDPFETARDAAFSADTESRYFRKARRPTRGIEIKDEVPAVLRVIRYDGTEVGLVDAGALSEDGISTAGYSNFLLQSVQEVRMEKHQIVETFGASYIFFFGEAPRFIDVQVVVINSLDFNWEAEWWENYENNFRGTKLVEQGARLYMFYDDNIVEGYMLNCQGAKVADQPLAVQLSFRMFVTGYRNVSLDLYNGDYPIRRGAISMPIEVSDPNQSGSAVANKTGLLGTESRQGGLLAETARYDEVGSDDVTGRIASQDFSDMLSPAGEADPALVAKSLTDGTPPVESLISQGRRPARSKIANNTDEYIGGVAGFEASWGLSVPIPEVDDLPSAAIENASEAGADIDDPDTMKDLGMISKSPAEQEKEADSFGQMGSFDDFIDQVSSVGKDPLDFVMGGGGTVGFSTGPGKAPKGDVYGASAGATFGSGGSGAYAGYTEKGEYKGVSTGSKYGDGPGFGGQTGNGEYGGTQTGSSMGDEKEPGLKDPDYSGEGGPETPQKRPEQYSVFSDKKTSLGDSTLGASGGASVSKEQDILFGMVSVEGSFG
jgi:hypothetical protein